MSNESIDQIVSVLRESLQILIENDDVDLVVASGGDEVEVVADEWTLTVWMPSGTLAAFLAIEDEPEDRAQLSAARKGLMSEAATDALSRANARLDGVLVAALRRSGDPLSEDLAAAIG